MSAPMRKGWCPTLLSPMASGDGWLVRIKPTASRITAAAAGLVAEASARHGSGHIDLTNRANLQIRGLTPGSSESFARIMIDAKLANADLGTERIRNVVASPLGSDDASAEADSKTIAESLEDMLAKTPALNALPPKFGFLADGGGTLPLTGLSADIMVRAQKDHLAVRLDGSHAAALCQPESCADTVRALALAFIDLAGTGVHHSHRMRGLVLKIGAEAIFEKAQLEPLRLSALPARRSKPPIGFIGLPKRETGAFGAGLPFGRIEAGALTGLAALCEQFGDGTLRLTPWRAFLLVGVAPDAAPLLAKKVEALGLITDSHDPRLRIFACVGKPACECASVYARADAAHFAQIIAGTSLTLHVSGCSKGCAHPGAANLTFVGSLGRYDVVRHASASAKPVETGLTLEQAVALLEAERENAS